MTRTIIIDDHKIFTEGLERLLNDSGEFQVVAKFYDGGNLMASVQELNPDLLVMDIEIGNSSGLDLLARIRLTNKKIKIVILSMHEEYMFSQESFSLGANGYLAKSVEYPILIESLLRVVQGVKVFPSTKRVVPQIITPISDRELEVLRLVVKGRTSDQIASELKISHLTVKTHRKNMMLKLKVNNAAELINIAIEKGYL